APIRSSAARAAHRGTRPLLHLFRANYACESIGACLGACLKSCAAAMVTTLKPRRTNKADQVMAQD
ncbi:hypothetical protein, partial [Pseudomonas peradeniyensis]